MRGSTTRFLRRDSRPENGTIRPLPSECCDHRFNHGNLRMADEITRTPIEGAKD